MDVFWVCAGLWLLGGLACSFIGRFVGSPAWATPMVIVGWPLLVVTVCIMFLWQTATRKG
jgi:hypothetical protein